MTIRCQFCPEPIQPGTRAVSFVGGMFPKEEPDLFMVDEQIMQETYSHLPCLLRAVRAQPKGPT